MTVLGIETSCDETAASICHDGRILSNIISSQVVHSSFGGVVPEIASREHELMLNSIVNDAISEANLSLGNLDAIAVTQGPGLAGALLTGVSFAKGLSIGLNISLIPINHLEAHIFANFLADPNLSYPFICLLISGGHTQLWLVKNIGIYDLLGETRDDAAGEAFDKGSRILGLGYPGGPQIEKISKNGNPTKIIFPRSLMGSDNLEFSFSGLKTSLLYFMDNFQESKEYRLADVAASYQQAIVDCLSEKLARAIIKTGIKNCVIAGGVAANFCLREELNNRIRNAQILYPDLEYCTDNAAMVSFLGEIKLKSGYKSNLIFNVSPNLKLN